MKNFIDEFNALDAPLDKYKLLIEYGEELSGYDKEKMNSKHLVRGCVSAVYINSEIKEGKVHFTGEADAVLVKGITYIITKGLSGMKTEDFLNIEEDFIKELGINQTLSPSRANSSYNILKTMQAQVKELVK